MDYQDFITKEEFDRIAEEELLNTLAFRGRVHERN